MLGDGIFDSGDRLQAVLPISQGGDSTAKGDSGGPLWSGMLYAPAVAGASSAFQPVDAPNLYFSAVSPALSELEQAIVNSANLNTSRGMSSS